MTRAKDLPPMRRLADLITDAKAARARSASKGCARVPLRLKPGSLTEDGAVVDYRGVIVSSGFAWVPGDLGVRNIARLGRRKELFGRAGWHKTPATNWPGIAPSSALACIERRP